MTLTHRLFLLIAIALLPAVAIQAYNEFDLRRSREAEVHELALRQAQLAASELDQIIAGVRNLLTAVAEVPSVRAFDTPSCTAYLATLRAKVPHIATIAAIDLEGRVACRHTDPPPKQLFADRPYFQQAIASGGFVVGEYTEARIADRPVLPLAMALRSPDGQIIGVVAAGLDLPWLSAHLHERGLARRGSITVADRNGVILARDPLPEQFVGTRIPEPFQRLVHADEPGSLELTSQDGTRRILGYVPAAMSPRNIYVSAGLSSDEAFAPLERATTRGVALIVTGLLLAMAAAWLAGRQFFHQPIVRLLGAARKWQAGDYAARTGLQPRQGEFGALGAAFDRMAEEIGRRETERDGAIGALRLGEARLRRAQEAGRIGDWEWDLASSTSVWSPSLYGLLGLTPDGPPPCVTTFLELIHPEDRERAAAEAQAAITTGHALDTEFRIIRPDGSMRWLASRGEIEHDGTGKAIRLVGVNIDITDRKQAEERQRLLLAELNHRVKNTLAIVQVIASRSLADERVPAEAREALTERLRALAKTHDLLTASEWRGASLRAIAEAELHPYGKRVEVANDDLILGPRAAQTIGLILHELVTNAAKHGALSVPGGRVSVTWKVEPGPEGGRFRLDWRERDGPTVRPPARQGFGRILIERAIAHELKGEAELQFLPEGLTYALEAPRAEVAA